MNPATEDLTRELLTKLSPSSQHFLVVAGLGHKELPFWEIVNEELRKSDSCLVFLCYSTWPTLPKTSFPVVNLHHYGYSVRPDHPECSVKNDERHVQAMWLLCKALLNIRAVLLWNGLHGIWKVWKHQLEQDGTPHLIVERGAFPLTFQLEQNGLNGLSAYFDQVELPKIGARENALLSGMRKYLLQEKRSHNSQPSELAPEQIRSSLKLSPSDRVVVYFGAWDEAAGINGAADGKLQSPHFSGSRETLEHIIKAAAGLPDVVILYKQHSADHSEWKCSTNGARILSVNHIGAHGLIELADVVAGLQSSLLYIAAMLDKPVLLLGNTALTGKGFAYEITCRDDLNRQLHDALEKKAWNERMAARDRFMHHYLSTHSYSHEPRLMEFGLQSAKAALDVIRQCQAPLNLPKRSSNMLETWAYTVALWSISGRSQAPRQSISNALLRSAAHAARTPLGVILSKMAHIPGFRAVGRFFYEIRHTAK